MTCFHFISTQFYTNTNILWVNQHVFAYAKEHPSSYELALLFFHLHRICKQEEAGVLGKAIHHLETYYHFLHDHFALVTFFFFFPHALLWLHYATEFLRRGTFKEGYIRSSSVLVPPMP